MFLMFCIAILHIYCFVRKYRKKCRKLAFSALLKHEYMISAWRTAVHDVQLSDRIKHLYGAFFLDITGFFAFSVVGCPIP